MNISKWRIVPCLSKLNFAGECLVKGQREKNIVLANEYVKRVCGYTRKGKDTI